MKFSQSPYPRPDFVRPDQTWVSLNGPWSFLFDDNDIGLSQKWHLSGLPDEVSVDGSSHNHDSISASGKAVVQKILGPLSHALMSDANHVSNGIGDAKTNRRQEINVPFAFQTQASGINDRGSHEVLWYSRSISDPRKSPSHASKGEEKVFLRFGAVDYSCTVWLDGTEVGRHGGGHIPFDLDITSALDASSIRNSLLGGYPSHTLTLRVRDSPTDLTQPRGKQYWAAKPEGIFYTPTSGIWQDVWLEVVPACRIADSSCGTIIQSNDIVSGKLHCAIALLGRRAGESCSIEIEASLTGTHVNTVKAALPYERDILSMDVPLHIDPTGKSRITAPLTNNLALWSPEHPTLYDLHIRLLSPSSTVLDEIHTSTGLRSLSWTNRDSTFRLNGEPYFHALVLDQGYWPHTGQTPPSQDHLKTDIQLAKNMGFNGCRKHQKVEHPAFLYWADRLGFMVWGEMANAYDFNPVYIERFDEEWKAAVKRDINHPSIVAWTPVNESWGYPDLETDASQRNHLRSLYWMTRTLDSTRPVVENDGWQHVATDLTTYHDYASAEALGQTASSLETILAPKSDRAVFLDPIGVEDEGARHKPGAPVLCTEFGGVNITPRTKREGESEEWGYQTAGDAEDLLKRFEELVFALVDGGVVCGFVYTQLADIEQEANGLLSADRKEKLGGMMERIRQVMEEAKRRYHARVTGGK